MRIAQRCCPASPVDHVIPPASNADVTGCRPSDACSQRETLPVCDEDLRWAERFAATGEPEQ
jgi:hypothetical protein